MYRLADKKKFEMTTIKKNDMGKVVLDKVTLKKKIMKFYQEIFKLTDIHKREKLIGEIQRLEKKL